MASWFRTLILLSLPISLAAQTIDLRTTEVATVTGVVDVVAAFDGSQRLYLVSQNGVIRVLENGIVRSEPFLDLSANFGGIAEEQGLLSVVFPPDYPSRRYFYIYYANNGLSAIDAYDVSADGLRAVPASRRTVLTITQPFTNHNGGKLLFGADGYLYLSTGDGGSANDPQNNAQNTDSLLGKILRIDTESGTLPYAIPPGNPFVGVSGRDEIWAIGLRNPWRMSFDPANNELYIADVGQIQREEVNIQPAGVAGLNYGWKVFEGTLCVVTSLCSSFSHTPPVAEYDHQGGNCSIVGGFVYRGSKYPNLVGTYLYGDYCTGRIWGIKKTGSVVGTPVLLRDTDLTITTFGVDERGDLYVFDATRNQLMVISDGAPITNPSIGAGFTGSWYDTAQSGHGIFIEVLDNDAMLFAWFTFRPDGGQAWVIGVGPILGDRAVIDAVLPEGGFFIPNFDPNDVTNVPWGRVTISFSDCNNGRIDYQTDGAFGTGSMRLQRLTTVAGTSCSN